MRIFSSYYWSDLYYDIKWGLIAINKYLPVVWKMRDWDFAYILEMLQFQLKLLNNTIKNGNEYYKDRNKKTEDISRVIELLENFINDDYVDRLGGLSGDEYPLEFNKLENSNLYEINTNITPEEKEQDNIIIKKAEELKEKEYEELWETIKKGNKYRYGIESWWN